jgi:hypothetical protein
MLSQQQEETHKRAILLFHTDQDAEIIAKNLTTSIVSLRHGVPFAIKAKDIRACFPKDGYCPITRLPFERGEGKCGPQSMSLDRIIPELGYVPGNIAVISHLANAIKQNCTDPEIFRRIADYLEEAQKPALRKAG